MVRVGRVVENDELLAGRVLDCRKGVIDQVAEVRGCRKAHKRREDAKERREETHAVCGGV